MVEGVPFCFFFHWPLTSSRLSSESRLSYIFILYIQNLIFATNKKETRDALIFIYMGQTHKKGNGIEIQKIPILYEKEAITNFQIMLSAVIGQKRKHD